MDEGQAPGKARMDVIVIGAMKAATSTICAYLEDHPDIYMVPGCEPNYFSHDDNFAKGPDWYATFLGARRGERLAGEGSNYYSARDLHPDSAARMAAYNPELKLIYMVRHPLDRIVSAWIQNRADSGDQVPPTLDRAVREMPDRFVGQSRYWHNLAPFRDHFGDARIFLGFMEDLNRDPAAFFRRLTGFLDLPEAPDIRRGHLNKSAGKRVPTPAYTALNNSPLKGIAKALLPRDLRRLVKNRLLSRPVSGKPAFSPGVRAELVEILRPDAAALLRHAGKPADFWTFE